MRFLASAKNIRIQSVKPLLAGLCLLTLPTTVVISHATPKPSIPNWVLLDNEQPIEFEAGSGKSTDAIEGHLYVPENRNNPDSRSIRVNYVRFPATTDKKGPPIIYLSGGPGGSGIATAKWRRYHLFQAMREFGDVIALDQRGTGASERAERCVSSVKIPLTERVKQDTINRGYRQAAKECFRKWQAQGIDIYGYTTVQNALDLEDLRKHLKADKVSLWGISYGSHLALAAMKLLPDSIDKVIIASAEGLNQTVKLPTQTDKYFQAVQTIIDQQPLKEAVPDLPSLMRTVFRKLEKNPLPITIKNKDGSKTKMLFQKQHLQIISSFTIADPNQYLSMLVGMYLELNEGKTNILEMALQQGIFKDEPLGFNLMNLAMDTASGITDKRLAKVKQQAETSLLGEYLNFPMPLLNKIEPGLDLGDDFRADPVSDIPTLLLTGTLDGRTYPEEQAQAVSGLTNLTLITVKHAGHNLYKSSPEVLETMKKFMSGEEINKTLIELPLPKLGF